MQDLIRVRIADPAQHPGIGQRPLQRTILHHQPSAKLRQRTRHHVDPARVQRLQLPKPRYHMERRPPLRAGLGHRQRAVLKVERRKSSLARQLRTRFLPVQPPRDHQVQHRPQIVLKADRDALAHSSQLPHTLPFERRKRRLHAAQEEDALKPHPHQPLAFDPRAQRKQIRFNIGQLRHRILSFPPPYRRPSNRRRTVQLQASAKCERTRSA